MLAPRRLIASLVMTLVTLVVAHNLVFLVGYGSAYNDALAQTGHGAAWGEAVTVVLAAGICLLVLAAWRLYRLGIVARSLDPGEGALSPSPGGFVQRLGAMWLRISAAAAFGFVVQENVEHLQSGQALPGWTVLGSAEYPNAALIIGAVALIVAFVGAAFAWQRERLVARISAALTRVRLRPARVARRPTTARDWRRDQLVGRGFGLRAPPAPGLFMGGTMHLTPVA